MKNSSDANKEKGPLQDSPQFLSKALLQTAGQGQPIVTGGLIIDASQNAIQVDGERHSLQPKVIELLVLLCIAEGRTVSKDELVQNLWPGVVVGPDSLANCMARLRKALNDDPKQPKYIETVQRKGYRWLLPVEPAKPRWPGKKEKYFAVAVCVLGLALFTQWWILDKPDPVPKKFPFADLSVTKLPNGEYRVAVGITGELTDEKKAMVLAEIKRITGEEGSDMMFSFDTDKPLCSHDKQDEKSESDCIEPEG